MPYKIHADDPTSEKHQWSKGEFGGGGKESNLPANAMPARPVLKTGGATGPLPPPGLSFQALTAFTGAAPRFECPLIAHFLPVPVDALRSPRTTSANRS